MQGETAVFLPDRVWNTLLVGIGGLFLVAFIWTYTLAKNLHVTRKLRFGWVSTGDRLSELFELENRSVIPLPPGQTGERARARQRSIQATINASSGREYQPGDPYRKIHWRISAHRDKLYVREFDLDAAGQHRPDHHPQRFRRLAAQLA